MFVSSDMMEGIGDAENLGLTIHQVLPNEMDSQERINANHLNGVTGDLPCPPIGQSVTGPCHFGQRALRIVYGGFKLAENQLDLVAGATPLAWITY